MYEKQDKRVISSNEKKSVRLSKLVMNMNESNHSSIFQEIEEDMKESGFCLAETNDVVKIFQQQDLFCRSESFEKIIDALVVNQDIDIANYGNEANMCIMASGQGFRIAMTEGFSGKEVGAKVKVVIVFRKSDLLSIQSIEKDSALWDAKRETAEVSLQGKGKILSEDIKMVSFRFPIKYFPKNLLTEEEQDKLDDDKISFIVRHYIKKEKEQVVH